MMVAAMFCMFVASLFELKAKSLLPQNEEVDWIDEIQLIKDKDLAFDALLTCQNGQQPGKLLVDVADKFKT